MNILDLNFINKAKAEHPESFKGKKILELGALDVNGDVREPFEDCIFTGIDWTPGKNVDIVVPAKETEFDNEEFDVMLSVNHLEHDPDWEDSIGHNLPAIKSGGLIILRWAGIGSSAHGPQFDPHGKLGYYPKSMAQVVEFLKSKGITIVTEYGDSNPYIGPMMNLIAKKP